MIMSRTQKKLTKLIQSLLLVVGFVHLMALAQTPEKITIKSHTPQDYADIFSGRYKQAPVEITGFLSFPVGQGKFPAVVIVPGSGGYQQWMQDGVAKRLNQAGIATLILDSFTGRGVGETATNQATVPMAASVLDGFSALHALSKRSEIDINRVGVTGFSRGGVVAMFTQDRRLVQAMGEPALEFAAHLPLYPGCATTFDKPTPTKAPSLFLMGGKDDYTPASQCLAYVDRLKAAGANVDSKIYPGAHHGWISDAKEVFYLPRVQVYSKCDMRIDDAGIIRELGSGSSTVGGWSAFVDKVWKSCGKSGAHYGVNLSARQESMTDMVKFFSSTLSQR